MLNTLEPFNKYFVCNFNKSTDTETIENELLRLLWTCNFTTENLEKLLSTHLSNQKDKLNDEEARTALCQAIELILIFVQYNFTGPTKSVDEFTELIANKKLEECDPFVKLIENGEEINSNVALGELFVIAKNILKQLSAQYPESLVVQWWNLRAICLHQQLIDELTSNLYDNYKKAAEFLIKHVDALADTELEALLYLEVANGYLLFHRSQKSDELLEELCKRLNVVLNVEGLLGVRTKFQQKPLPQLCLKVEHANDEYLRTAKETNGNTSLPKLLLLEDDTRLERIRFIEPKDNDIMTLPSVLQALVLAKVKQLKRSQPKDRLADEELEPYIQTLLYQECGPLQVRLAVLLLNCVQESSQRRTVERSWKQCEEAVKLLNESTYSTQDRLSYAFAGFLQPTWQVKMQLCELLLSLGMTKTALDIYLKIKAWEQVINCYTRLELRNNAAEIIRQELQKKPTALLHCLLGDATDDPTHYETAWQFSKETSGKAQAHWGNYFFGRKEYEKAIEHLEKSVQINSLQEKIWLRLGYAAIMIERWELAVHAYITYTHLEPLGFESWNNLAKALIKLGDKMRAHKVLSESLKCNYHNWKVWENFMLVSVDTGHFEDAINAYNRLSDLKQHFLDLEVLCVTMTAIAQGKPDAKGQTAERLHKKAVSLMAQQCIKHGNESKVWELAALLAKTPLDKAQKLIKSYRSYTSKELAWASKQPFSLKALQLTREICTLSLQAITEHSTEETPGMITSQLSSARLSAQACIRAVEKETENWPENQELLQEVKELFERTTEQVKQRMENK
ncbi:tetratricopeptide repeat protein 27-like [Teleopsis dalmanni]|uniref:tetratricopeptide repeat protein 27-like n=1 Tax=Teleopsis dalmanni TaxID=139649 RepID=UPI0018CF1CEF|nr:tetratricopeptide repeat protein 27-like [Teleopsis dalmanni]